MMQRSKVLFNLPKLMLVSILFAFPMGAHSLEIVDYSDAEYAADNSRIIDYSDADYAADNNLIIDYSDADYAAENVAEVEYTDEDYAADQYDETAYAPDHDLATVEEKSKPTQKNDENHQNALVVKAVKKKVVKKKEEGDDDNEDLDEEDDESDDADDDEDDETETLAGDFESLVIPEVSLDYDKTEDDAAPSQLSANVYAYYELMLTEDIEFLVEGNINTQAVDPEDRLALSKPALNINSIGFNYYTDFGGIGIGKFDLLRDETLFNAVWARQLYGRESLPSSDLDLSDVIGIRTWIDLEDVLPGSHTLYLGAFFRDNTFLNEDYLSRSGNTDERIRGLGYTRRLNNWMVSLQGSDFEALPGWEYVVGASFLNNDNPDIEALDDEDNALDLVSREISLFSGLYGEFELSDSFEINPLIEVLYRDGADGFDQSVFSFATGIALNQNNWTYGGYYSTRRTFDKTEEEYFHDSQFQAFLSYTFDSGVYLDIEHQRNIFDDERSHATFVSLGIPITLSSEGNIYGRRPETRSDDPKSNVRRFIRRR